MTKRTIEFLSENGDSILMEVDLPASNRIGLGDEIAQKAQKTFESALDTIQPSASTIIKKLRSLNEPASEVEVKFSIKMNAGLDFVVAAGNAEANYEITLKWKQELQNDRTA